MREGTSQGAKGETVDRNSVFVFMCVCILTVYINLQFMRPMLADLFTAFRDLLFSKEK
jgi:hypothetical protein